MGQLRRRGFVPVAQHLVRPAREEVVSQEATLDDKKDWQSVFLAIPPKQAIAAVELRIVSTASGSVYKDGCISDLRFFVDSDVPYDAAYEQGKRDALLAWGKGRKDIGYGVVEGR